MTMRSLFLLIALSAAASAQTLTGTERAVARAVDVHNSEALALLERVVNINSGTMNIPGVRAVGEVFVKEFEALGFNARLEQGTPDRAPHLVAEHPGPGPKLLLIGHLDTVFEPSSPFQRFERLSDTTARGPGIIDMKGGNVIIVYALRALKDAGLLDRLNVVVVMTGDEEAAGRPLAQARRALVNAARGAAYAIGFEDGPGDPRYAVISRRSSSGWRLTTTMFILSSWPASLSARRAWTMITSPPFMSMMPGPRAVVSLSFSNFWKGLDGSKTVSR